MKTKKIKVYEVLVGTENRYYDGEMFLRKRFTTKKDAIKYARDLIKRKDIFDGWDVTAKYVIVEVDKCDYEDEICELNFIGSDICERWVYDVKWGLLK